MAVPNLKIRVANDGVHWGPAWQMLTISQEVRHRPSKVGHCQIGIWHRGDDLLEFLDLLLRPLRPGPCLLRVEVAARHRGAHRDIRIEGPGQMDNVAQFADRLPSSRKGDADHPHTWSQRFEVFDTVAKDGESIVIRVIPTSPFIMDVFRAIQADAEHEPRLNFNHLLDGCEGMFPTTPGDDRANRPRQRVTIF